MKERIQLEIKEKISEIEEKSADGNYIYRGERKCYEEVCSSLWRQFQKERFDMAVFDIEKIQTALLKDAQRYDREPDKDDFEFMAQLQHTGGDTNLIDLTTDYLVALFFACDGSHDKPGRVILLKQTEQIRNKYKVKEPRNPINRVIAQKSIFVQPPQGVIERDDIETVCIRAKLKEPILTYLRKYHGIFTQNIYNDLQGYIKHRQIHYRAYKQAGIGTFHKVKGLIEGGEGNYDEAIRYYNEAIKLHPDFAEAYYQRGDVHSLKHDFDSAIIDFTKVIELNPDFAEAYSHRGVFRSLKHDFNNAIADYTEAILLDAGDAGDPAVHYNCGRTLLHREEWIRHAKNPFVHYNRGIAWLHLEEWEKARLDLTYAKDMGVHLINAFGDAYEGIEVFEERYGVQLPADIAEMLTSMQS